MAVLEVEMSLYEAILARRSVRSFTTQKLDKETIPSLLEAAIRAPTAMHIEPWAFVIIQGKKILKELSDQIKVMLVTHTQSEQQQPSVKFFEQLIKQDFNIFYNASTLILICSNTSLTASEADCWLAAENLILAACAMGLGTCIIGCAAPVLNLSEIKTKLGIASEFTVVAPIIVGHPSDTPVRSPRKHPKVLSNIQTN
ncbi:nitroreductase family protein [Methylotenera mobilis]|uniref:Nitroreductase n=1 Tax=Methylotenera mobilis (strain JLW8 / ATCC BAA-1282 / DSM 17540) TaxID=583345 RepID=C6WWL4_METML|nr:nitroreductase family protein [Methylotenera mobilis]ACT48313.1 nitroreductase [Methylotenera mobilis JLW8]